MLIFLSYTFNQLSNLSLGLNSARYPFLLLNSASKGILRWSEKLSRVEHVEITLKFKIFWLIFSPPISLSYIFYDFPSQFHINLDNFLYSNEVAEYQLTHSEYADNFRYRIRRCLVPPKRPTIAQIREGGLDNGDFLFLKIFQNFLKFYNFCTKSATGGLFYYYFIVFK